MKVVSLIRKGVKGCSDMSGREWKNSLLKPWKNGHFSYLALFFPLSLPKIWNALPFISYFSQKYENRGIITRSFILIT